MKITISEEGEKKVKAVMKRFKCDAASAVKRLITNGFSRVNAVKNHQLALKAKLAAAEKAKAAKAKKNKARREAKRVNLQVADQVSA